jgi:hypothetical protein
MCVQVILVSFGVIGFGIGFFTQQLSHAVYMVLAGFAISCIVTLPPWGYFRRQQLKVSCITSRSVQSCFNIFVAVATGRQVCHSGLRWWCLVEVNNTGVE